MAEWERESSLGADAAADVPAAGDHGRGRRRVTEPADPALRAPVETIVVETEVPAATETTRRRRRLIASRQTSHEGRQAHPWRTTPPLTSKALRGPAPA